MDESSTIPSAVALTIIALGLVAFWVLNPAVELSQGTVLIHLHPSRWPYQVNSLYLSLDGVSLGVCPCCLWGSLG